MEHAAKQRLGVDVCFEHNLIPPQCMHGPTLLFERYMKGDTKRFFACSAYRDRRECDFYCEEDKVRRDQAKGVLPQPSIQSLPESSGDRSRHHISWAACKACFNKDNADQPMFCHHCRCLVPPKEIINHSKHQNDLQPMTNELLTHPTRLMRALDNNKTHAQFLFSNDTAEFLVNAIKNIGAKNVMCLGTPRMHEAISQQEGMSSLLLDLDGRYAQFYPDTFCLFNMCNGHLFNDNDRLRYESFIATCDVMIVDPPFGAMAQILAHGLKKISTDWKSHNTTRQAGIDELPVLFVFPYFLEQSLVKALPNLVMGDYRVNYENHATYHGGRNEDKPTKKESPVRIFTNIPAKRLRLPSEEGYRWCELCQCDVASTNHHCDICNACTTKSGATYRHCELCNRCVKPSLVHCHTCNYCALPDHDCQK
eukprot:Ihof_evm1s739 gene=Ihof_evmTU1s739